MKTPQHHIQVLVDEAKIAAAIATENDEWIAKQMLESPKEFKIIKNVLSKAS